MTSLNWQQEQEISSRSYRCGYCGNSVAPAKGWHAIGPGGGSPIAYIHICHHCHRPTFHDENGDQFPGVSFGTEVSGIEDSSVQQLYDEARNAMSVNAYTSVVLDCRKLLMHIAVSKGAKSGESFVSYVQYLADNHYIPPDAKEWVDHIRERGNEANHEINIMSKDDAELLVSFVEMLLKVIYEFPSAIRERTGEG